ncbi:MAG: hypothetical protein LUH50_08820 [Bacteroides intestinalis]|nr:hypothetical protein [Bacteroides intestinalis]
MKRTFLIVLSLCTMLLGKAQERAVLDLSNNSSCRFEVTYNDLKTIYIGIRSIDQLRDLYNMDVCGYYNLTQYDTELKRKTFINSEDGKALLETMKNVKANLGAKSHYYIFPFSANMGWEKAYNLKTKTFDFGYIVDETGFLPVSGYLNFPKFAIKCSPKIRQTVQKRQNTDRTAYLTTIKIPMSESDALAIEEHIDNLALAVQFTIQGWGETKRKINLFDVVLATTCVRAVSPKIYIIDKNTNEIYFEL